MGKFKIEFMAILAKFLELFIVVPTPSFNFEIWVLILIIYGAKTFVNCYLIVDKPEKRYTLSSVTFPFNKSSISLETRQLKSSNRRYDLTMATIAELKTKRQESISRTIGQFNSNWE